MPSTGLSWSMRCRAANRVTVGMCSIAGKRATAADTSKECTAFWWGRSRRTPISRASTAKAYRATCSHSRWPSTLRNCRSSTTRSPTDLHLLRFCPHAWISPDEETRFERMPTEFGPVDLRFRLSEDGRTLNLTFRGDWREKPRRLVLHTPQLPGLERIVVNGRDCGKTKEIILTT